MSLAKFSVERPVAVTMRIAALVLLGAVCLTKLPIDLLPKVSIPTVAVVTGWANVAPEDIETQVTRPIEEAVSQVENVYTITSTSVTGQSTVRVQFNWGADIDAGAVDVLQLVQRARINFPTDPNLQQSVVFKYDPSTLPIMIYGVSGDPDPIHLRTILDNEITPMVESANGVAAATDTGGLQRAIMVDVDPKKLQAYGLSFSDVQSRIAQENIDLPAGIARQNDTEYTIRAYGYFDKPSEIAQIPVGTYQGQVVALGQVADVRDSSQEQRISTRLNGQPAVGMIITKQSDANTVDTANNVREKIKQVNKIYPNLKFDLAYDQSGFITNSINDLKMTAMIGGSLAIIILMMFLRNIRSTAVVAMSIPISILSTFTLLYFCGFTLNTFTLSGLALATGLIVDDAVVVLENIFRHIERDKRRAAEAAVSGANEIFSAVTASTLTIIIVFLPLLLIKGQAGQMFTQFAFVVIFSISLSLLDATTVVPMLASRFISEEQVEEEAHPELAAQRGKKPSPIGRLFNWAGARFSALDAAYHRGLLWSLRHRWWVFGGALGVTAVISAALLPTIGSEMLPQTDSGDININVKHPVGTSYEQTDATMKAVEKIVLKDKDVAAMFSAAGTGLSLRGASTTQISYQGAATVHLKDDRKLSTAATVQLFRKELAVIPGARIQATTTDLVTMILTGGATNMEVDIFGPNYEQDSSVARQVSDALRKIPGLTGVDLNIQEKTPELRWKVDRNKALAYGVSFQDIANTLTTASAGALTTYFQENGFQVPIYVEVPANERKTIDQIMNLPITPSYGGGGKGLGSEAKAVLIRQVATPYEALGPNEVDRLDRVRYVAVQGQVLPNGRAESEVQADVGKAMAGIKMPNGMYWDYGLQQKRRGEEFAGLGLAIFMAIALVYMLLASQFESFIYPLVVLVSVPLAASGVLLALYITDRKIGLTAFIGMLMLIGIAVKNGILLVDYTNQLRTRGMKRDDAILTASPTRLRPILMTSCAAILGMLPLAIGMGKGSETQTPLATAVVGGLLTSTVLTLFVVPCVYTMFDDLSKRLRRSERDLYAPSLVGPSVGSVEHASERAPEFPSPQAPTPTPLERSE
ncbi:MAG: efflux RND transporter permease subunit [Fimbriimonadaceae bacterium]